MWVKEIWSVLSKILFRKSSGIAMGSNNGHTVKLTSIKPLISMYKCLSSVKGQP